MYTLHIDESGNMKNFKGVSYESPHDRYFALGGIITKDLDAERIKLSLNAIIEKYLNVSKLGKNFKLHFHDLRYGKPPYDVLVSDEREMLTNDVFNLISNENLWLISSCIDLHDLHENCSDPVSQHYLTLSSLLERFEYFLAEKQSSGKIIHEFIEKKANRRIQTKFSHTYMRNNYKNSKLFNRVIPTIMFKKTAHASMLQLCDFFAYSVIIKAKSDGEKQDRWKSICSKYYNLDHADYEKRGNAKIEDGS